MTLCDPGTGDHAGMKPPDPTARVPAAPAKDTRAKQSDPADAPAPGSLIDERDRQAFLDILSHELRTPVTTIYGGAQLLAKRDLKGQRRRALAEDVRVEADRLYRLVEDLVILVNSDRDGIHPVGEPVAVGRLVSAAIEREVASHPGVRIALLGASDAAADGADEEMVDPRHP